MARLPGIGGRTSRISAAAGAFQGIQQGFQNILQLQGLKIQQQEAKEQRKLAKEKLEFNKFVGTLQQFNNTPDGVIKDGLRNQLNELSGGAIGTVSPDAQKEVDNVLKVASSSKGFLNDAGLTEKKRAELLVGQILTVANKFPSSSFAQQQLKKSEEEVRRLGLKQQIAQLDPNLQIIAETENNIENLQKLLNSALTNKTRKDIREQEQGFEVSQTEQKQIFKASQTEKKQVFEAEQAKLSRKARATETEKVVAGREKTARISASKKATKKDKKFGNFDADFDKAVSNLPGVKDDLFNKVDEEGQKKIELITSMKELFRGKVSGIEAASLINAATRNSDFEGISSTILDLKSQGLSDKQIAEQLRKSLGRKFNIKQFGIFP